MRPAPARLDALFRLVRQGGANGLRTVHDDAATDGIGSRWADVGLWFPLVTSLLLGVVYAVHRPSLYWLMRDDHPVEWLQFSFCAFTAVVAVMTAARLRRRGDRGLAVVLVLVALGGLVLAGEEISWGQRVFGLVEPGLQTANKQGELNVHNLNAGGFSADHVSEFVQLLMALGAAGVSWLTRASGAPWRGTPWWWVAPPLFTVPSFLLMAGYRALRLTTGTTLSPVIVYQEWAEFCFYLMIALTVTACYARAAPERYVVAGGRAARRRLDPTVRAGVLAPVVVAVLILAVTVVFAVMTMSTGLVPGNIPQG